MTALQVQLPETLHKNSLNIEDSPRIPFDTIIPEKAKVQTGDVLVARTGSVGQAVDITESYLSKSPVISSDFIRLVLKEPERAAYISAFLNSWAGRSLQEKIMYGAVQPHISQNELLELPIPRMDKTDEERIGEFIHLSRKYNEDSKELIQQAKQDVENLIEGTFIMSEP